MYLLHMFHLLWVVLFKVEVNGADVNCASFQSTSTSINWNNTFTVTLTFAINNECPVGQGRVKSVKVKTGILDKTVCHITIENELCGLSFGCSCMKSDGRFVITKHLNTIDNNEWSLVGILDQGSSFHETVSLQTTTTHVKTSHAVSTERDSTTSKTAAPTTSDLSSTVPSQQVPSTTEPTPVTNNFVIYILIGVVVFVLMVVTILAIFVGVLFKKRARSRRLPPPPPAPHNFRRAVADAVMFHAQAAGLGDSDSFTNAQGHEYDEIPDDTDLSISDNSLPSLDSSPVSDSSMSDDCLHHIACPSSDSSLPEDYLHPSAATAEEIAAASPGTLTTREPSVHGQMMTIAEHCRGDPPYVNTVDM